MKFQNKKETLGHHFDGIVESPDKWQKCNRYYHKNVGKLINFLVPQNKSVLEIGCGTGDLLAKIKTSKAVGIDINSRMIEIAKRKHPQVEFYEMNAYNFNLNNKFDYIIVSYFLGLSNDIEKTLEEWHKICHFQTKIIIIHYNFLWEPVIKLAEKMGLKMPEKMHNWLSINDISQLLHLADFEVIKTGNFLLFPKYVPLISDFLNKYIARIPVIKKLCLINYIVARPSSKERKEYTVSVIVPTRNERGNIAGIVRRMPQLGRQTEIIFVGCNSKDGTDEEIKSMIKINPEKNMKFFLQDGVGKADAVRKGFDNASGDVLMILDADLSTAPEDLKKFYKAIASGKGEFINGSRLVYPLEEQSMRFFNIIGNKFFSLMFSWLLDMHIKDTLCGTKVLFAGDYRDIKANKAYFGNFDPFGDFDLLFGASKLNLKIVELPARYYARTYGQTNISRWRHGWLLLKMTLFAMKKIKFF